MEEDLQKLLGGKSCTNKQAEALQALRPGSWCAHKSWGFGRVAAWNSDLGQVVIDFEKKSGHAMDALYAADSLTPVPGDHILVLKATDPEGFKNLAMSDPAGFMRRALASYGGSATQETISEALAGPFDAAGVKKFWENTKKALKKDGHFGLPARKGDPWVLRESRLDRHDELLQDFRSAKRIKDQAAAADAILREIEAFAADPAPLAEVVAALDDYARKHLKLKPSESAEAVILANQIAARAPSIPRPNPPQLAALLRLHQNALGRLFEGLPAARLRDALAALPEAFPADWTERAAALLPAAAGRFATELVRLLEENGHAARAEAVIARMINEQTIGSDLLLWFCQERASHSKSLLTPKALSAIVAALERDLLNESRKTRLQDYLIEDKELVGDLLQGSSFEEARDLARRVLASPAIEEINKRSIVARMSRVHPGIQSLLSGGEAAGEAKGDAAPAAPPAGGAGEPLIVSWESLERRKAEYDDLINRQIPENVKQISIARSYGDLRENFEFKSAKEMERVLARRKMEMELDLSRAMGTDFSNADTSQVSIGTRVEITDLATGQTETFAILGAWDSDPEKGVVAYLTALGRALLGKKPGEEAVIPGEKGERRVRVGAITPWKTS